MKPPPHHPPACRRVGSDLHREVAFGLESFRGARPLGRTWIKNRRVERAAEQVRREDLVAVNVSGKDGRKARRDRTAGDDIGSAAEDIVDGTDRGALDRLVHTQQPNFRRRRAPSRPFDEIREALGDLVSLVRESRDGHADAAKMQRERPRSIEDVNARMHGEERIRNRRALVVPGNDDDRHAGVGEPLERCKCLQHDGRLHAASKKDVAAVDDQIDLPAKRRLQRALEPGEEPRQTEMGVGEEEDPQVVANHASNVQPDDRVSHPRERRPRRSRRRGRSESTARGL